MPGLADPLPVGPQAFEYDDAGNRDDDPTVSSPWSYNENYEIEASPELKYEFDLDGNLCKWVPAGGSITTGCAAGDADETRFTFDHGNRLRRIDRPDGSVVTYRYDPFGRRLEKTVSGVTTWFVWDGDQLLGEYDPAGARTTRYAYAGGFAPVQVAYPNGSGGEDVHEVHTNHLETPRMLTASDGSVAWRSYLEAYGRAHVDSAWAGLFNVRFPGQYYDGESERWNPSESGFVVGSGMHDNWWRPYDGTAGRFVTADPIGQFGLLASRRVSGVPSLISSGDLTDGSSPILRFGIPASEMATIQDAAWQPVYSPLTGAGANRYEYAKGNPAAVIDPSGLNSFSTLSFIGRNTAQGIGAFIDGMIPGADPVADAGGYDPCDPTLQGSRLAGQVVLGAELALGAAWAGLHLAGYSHTMGFHGAHHVFKGLGRLPHIQMNIWRSGVKGSGRTVFRIPLPRIGR